MLRKSKLGDAYRFWRYKHRTEKESIDYIESLDLTGATVLDIGANRGIYSYFFSRAVGKDGHIIAFEPQPECLNTLKKIESRWKIPHFDIRTIALSDQNGEVTLNRDYAEHGGASIQPNFTEYTTNDPVSVKMTTLDDISDSFPRPVRFIKCDVEGSELAIFRGGRALLTHDMPTILVEVHKQGMDDVLDLLESYGYEGFFIIGDKAFPARDYHLHPYRKAHEIHRNYIFKAKA